MTEGADRTTSLRYVAGHPYLYLPPGRWRVEVRADRRHRFKAVETKTVGEQGLLYPVPGETDDIRAVRVADDPWAEEFARGVTPI